MGELLLKCAAHCALDKIGTLDSLWNGLQFGVGFPQGVEAVVHPLRERFRSSLSAVVGSIDVTNAYNSLSRSAMLTAVYSTPLLRPLFGLISMQYSSPSSLFTGRHTVRSEQGVRQGDVLGPLLFAIAIHGDLMKAASEFPSVVVKAYLDDINFAGEPLDCANFVKRVSELLGRRNLNVNLQKCVVTGHTFDNLQPFTELGFACSTTAPVARLEDAEPDIVKLLGAAVGSTDELESVWCLSQAKRLEGFFDCLGTVDLPNVISLKLLRLCGATKWTHIARTHAPAASAASCEFFDSLSAGALARILGVQKENLPPECFIPQKGTAIIKIADIKEEAYSASYEKAMAPPEMKAEIPDQATRTKPVFEAKYKAIVESRKLSEPATIALREASEASPHAPIRALSAHSASMLSDFALQCAVFSMCALELPLHTPITCPGCSSEVLPSEVFDHAMCCKHITGVTRTCRHEMIIAALRSTLARFAIPNALPASGYVEPSSPKRPDLLVFCGSTAFSTDISVVHLSAQSNVSRGFAISARHFHFAQSESTIDTQQQQQPRVTPSCLLLSPREASSTRTQSCYYNEWRRQQLGLEPHQHHTGQSRISS